MGELLFFIGERPSQLEALEQEALFFFPTNKKPDCGYVPSSKKTKTTPLPHALALAGGAGRTLG